MLFYKKENRRKNYLNEFIFDRIENFINVFFKKTKFFLGDDKKEGAVAKPLALFPP